MAALTSHDYKAQRRTSRHSQRLRDFGYGAACGALLTGIACAWLGSHPHPASAQLNAEAQHAARSASGTPSAPPAGIYTFPQRLPGHELDVVVPAKDPRQDPANVRNGPGR
jgi:hypothetical protein